MGRAGKAAEGDDGVKCKFEHDGDCFNCSSSQYMYRCKPDVCQSAVPMTNADRINAMTIEEKAEFLSSIDYGRETPWSEPFARKLCDSCQTVHGTYESGVEYDFHECDFVDGKCPHGSAIVWWLQQPCEGGE